MASRGPWQYACTVYASTFGVVIARAGKFNRKIMATVLG